jgi:hypothetical protein
VGVGRDIVVIRGDHGSGAWDPAADGMWVDPSSTTGEGRGRRVSGEPDGAEGTLTESADEDEVGAGG